METLDFVKFVDWSFLGIIAGAIIWCASFLGALSKSVQDLNVKLAVILERLDTHENRLERLENKVAER